MFHKCDGCCAGHPATVSPRQRLNDVISQAEEVAGQAREQAREHLVPLAAEAKERLVPIAEAAAEKARPVVDKARPVVEKARPMADKVRPVVEKARPVVDGAIVKVTDVVSADIKPRLAEWREQAGPVIDEAGLRGRQALAALKGEQPAAAEPEKRRHPILKALGLAALLVALGVIIRSLLQPRDDGWQLQDATAPAADEQTTPAAPAPGDPFRYGEGSYIGAEPPEGYVIKGNERSMKYHVPTALGYERTVTDIWFNSPEAAERAGFTRALR